MKEDHGSDTEVLFSDFTAQVGQGLYISRRGGKVLTVDPDSASWAVISARQADVLEKLGEPVSFSILCALLPHFDPSDLRRLLEIMYRHGFVDINGRSFFPSAALMWRPADDRPIYPRSFYLHMTDSCNFHCTYCYARATGKGRSMSVKTAQKIVDRILCEIPFGELFVEFHGGEPLLMKDEIRAIVEYGEKRSALAGKILHFSVQTNGSLLDRDFARFAVAHAVKVGISLDGPPELHNRHRVDCAGNGTFDTVWRAVRQAEAEGLRCGFMSVIHDPKDYLRAYEFFLSRAIMTFKLNYSDKIGRASEEMEFDETRGSEMARGYLEMADAAASFNAQSPIKVIIHDLNHYLGALLEKRREYMCLRSPCGAGRSILAFGTAGDIYPCEEMSTYSEFRCGDISDAMPLSEMIDTSPVICDMRARTVDTLQRCRECPWRRFCSGRCLHKAYHCYGTTEREDPMCGFYSHIFEELMWRIDANPVIKSLHSR
jgi:radical SAM protein with 4Fe4S-binding SPASM domain